MTEESRRSSQLVATWAQFVAICIGIGTILVYMGRKDQQLSTTTEQVKELSSIVSELAKAQIGITLKNQQTEERLRDLAARLERLERTRL
jgi:methylphosphotriester-DNA--protein-cysteine methyltransferase